MLNFMSLKSPRINAVKVIFPLFALLGIFIPSTQAAMIPFDIEDVYSSINIFGNIFGISEFDPALYQEIHGVTSTSFDIDYDLGALSGSHSATIAAFPDMGLVSGMGESTTMFEGRFDGFFQAFSKHVVLGMFMVPDVGDPLTKVFLDIDLIDGFGASALFAINPNLDFELFQPGDRFPPWAGANPTRVLMFSYNPSEIINFAFGLEIGVGAGGAVENFSDADSVSSTFRLFTEDPPAAVIPEPSALLMFGLGFLGLAFRRKS